MSYPAMDIDGLDLFTMPFRSPQSCMADPASNRGTARPSKQPQATAPRPGTSAPPVRQAEDPASVRQARKPDIPEKPVSEEKKTEKVPEETQEKVPELAPEQKSKAKPEPSKKELTMDMSGDTVPVEKSLEASEETKRKAHEASEAKRKAEWEARQLAKKQAEDESLRKLQGMSDADVVAASTARVRTDTEKLTRRNMKECVSDHIQSVCQKDPEFARRTMHPKKSMIHCFRYINRMAKDYIKQEMEDNDIRPDAGGYGSDVPDDLCYQWAVDYFNNPDAPEDQEKEEKFIPRPYVSTASKKKKAATSKKTTKKDIKQEPANNYEQMSLGV